MQPVGFWRRLAAYLIDVIPLTAAAIAVGWFFFGFDEACRQYFGRPRTLQTHMAFRAARDPIRDWAFVALILYGVVMEGSPLQGTIGKRLMGMIVVDAQGRRLTWLGSVYRNLSKLLSYLTVGLGFLWIGVNARKRALHDAVSRTYVVRHTSPPRLE